MKQFVFNAQTNESYMVEIDDIDEPIEINISKSEIEILQEKNEALQTQLAQTNSDLQGFMDFYFMNNS